MFEILFFALILLLMGKSSNSFSQTGDSPLTELIMNQVFTDAYRRNSAYHG